MRRALAAIIAAAALGGCTTTSAVMLSADRAILTTSGNAFTSADMVVRDLYLEAAKRAQAGGYEWFAILDSQDASTSGVYVSPARGSAYASGNASAWSGSASYTGASAIPYTKPGVRVLVAFGRGPMPNGAVSAAEVIALNAKQ